MQSFFSQKQAFTFVELIVVVTILAILSTIGFVTYSNYLGGVRDANRISQLEAIGEGLKLHLADNLLPQPDDQVTIISSGSTVGYQGYAGTNILETIGYSKPGLDPKDKQHFTYRVSQNRKKYQLAAFLEEADNLQAFGTFINQTYATPDYAVRYVSVFGEKLGVLTDTNNVPIQELGLAGNQIDVATTATDYRVYFSDDNSYTGQSTALAGKLDLYANYTNNFLPNKISNLLMWFDASDLSKISTTPSNEVIEWFDKSGKGNHFSEIEGDPTYGALRINGKDTIYCDGDDNFVTETTFNAPYTVITAVQMEGTDNERVVGSYSNGTNTVIGFLAGSKHRVHAGAHLISSNPQNVTTNPELISFSRASNLASSFYNNGEYISLSNPTAGNATFGDFMLCGGHENYDGFSKVYLMESIVYNKVLSDSERKKVESYLNAKWGGF